MVVIGSVNYNQIMPTKLRKEVSRANYSAIGHTDHVHCAYKLYVYVHRHGTYSSTLYHGEANQQFCIQIKFSVLLHSEQFQKKSIPTPWKVIGNS